MVNSMKKNYKSNKIIFLCIIFFFLSSILSIYSASIYLKESLYIKQILWYIIGSIVIYGIFKIKNKYFYDNTKLFYFGTIILLFLLLLFAPSINGSKCWFVLPKIGNFQPSEFMKIFLILILSKEVYEFNKSESHTTKEELKFLGKYFLLVALPSILTFLEPDTGAVIIYLVIAVTLLFFSNLRIRWFILLISIFILGIGSIFYLYFYQKELFIQIFSTKLFYRLERILSWTDKTSYQLENALIAEGTSGILGHGIKKIPLYFPEGTTDFIFATLLSTFGFLGSITFLIVTFIFDIELVKIIIKSKSLNKYTAIGSLGMLLYQQVQNIGMNIGLLPITGITLPFLSYGGSSLLSYMILMGFLININYQNEKRHISMS